MKSKGNIVGFKVGNALYICGAIMLILMALVILSVRDEAKVFVCLACLAGAAFCFWKVVQGRRLIQTFYRYVSIISSEPVKTVSRIAQLTTTSEKQVRKNIRMMLERRLFTNAYVNQAGELVVPDSASIADPSKLVSHTCTSCGGINQVIPGKITKCRFCGVYIRR